MSHDHEIIEVPRRHCQLGLLRNLSDEEWEEEVGPLIQCDYEGARYDARILQIWCRLMTWTKLKQLRCFVKSL